MQPLSPLCLGGLLVAAFLLTPATAAAISRADYQKNLQHATNLLETLIEDEESYVYSEDQFNETIDSVRRVLPERESVEAEGTVCSVDNAWLHSALTEIQKAPAHQQQAKLKQLIERLGALEQHAGYETRDATSDNKAQAKQKLESILARPEYVAGAKGPNALTRLIRDFMRWLEQFLPKKRPLEPGRASWVSFIAQVLVVLIALAILIYALKALLGRLKVSRRQRAPKKRKARIILGERLEPEDTATDLLSEAEALARRGDLRAAIRKAYIALLVELGDRKILSLAQHKTNRDYLNAVRNVPQLHSRMSGLTERFERHWYGFVNATDNDWQDFRDGYRAALQTEN